MPQGRVGVFRNGTYGSHEEDAVPSGSIDYPLLEVSSDLAPLGAEKFMYAIVKTGGKQYKAEKDDVLIVDKIAGEPGVAVEFEVLAVVDGETTTFGAPFVSGASVKAEIVRQAKTKKINAFNYKAKKNERKRWGHRQEMTHVRVTSVEQGK